MQDKKLIERIKVICKGVVEMKPKVSDIEEFTECHFCNGYLLASGTMEEIKHEPDCVYLLCKKELENL